VRLKEAEGKRGKNERFRRKRNEDKIYIRKTKVRLVREVKRIGVENLNKEKSSNGRQSAECTVYVQYALEHNDWRD
jgi:hypothetical protein